MDLSMMLARLFRRIVDWWRAPSLAEEKRQLRKFHRLKAAAERRGEIYPPHDSGRPGGRLF